jgi:hypothetical protein
MGSSSIPNARILRPFQPVAQGCKLEITLLVRRLYLAADAYRALNFLIQKNVVDPKRAAVARFVWGALQGRSAIERGAIEQRAGTNLARLPCSRISLRSIRATICPPSHENVIAARNKPDRLPIKFPKPNQGFREICHGRPQPSR